MTHVAGEIGVVEAFRFDHADPEHAARVRRARHAGLFAQFDETFRLDLERQPPAIRAERAQHREHLARDAPDEVDFPLHRTRRAGPARAQVVEIDVAHARFTFAHSALPSSRRARPLQPEQQRQKSTARAARRRVALLDSSLESYTKLRPDLLNLPQAFLELGRDRWLNFRTIDPKKLDNGLTRLSEKFG
jgi:hypothetical protein